MQNEPTTLTATLADAVVRAGQPATRPVAPGTAVSVNRSNERRVSLNELNEEGTDLTAYPNGGPVVGDIAPIRVDLQNRITRVNAVKDNDTNGGRTKIDISWPRTYSHKNAGSDGSVGTTDDAPVYATEYRIQWSTNPDASDWNLLDQNEGDAEQQDFTAAQADCPSDGTEDTCTVSHEGLTAGTKYTYRVFAMNTPDDLANVANTVFSWWQIGAATTSQAEVPGRPLDVTANQSISNGHTQIDLVWDPPTSDHDGGGDGDGYGVIIEYDIEKSDDGGNSWSALATVTPAKDCTKAAAGVAGATHKGVGTVTRIVNTPTRNWRPDRRCATGCSP